MEIYKGYIKGTNRKDSKIIEFFESKGGINSEQLEGSGGAPYIIQEDKTISDTDGQAMESYYNAQQEFEDWLNGVSKPTETYPENRWWIDNNGVSLLFVPDINTDLNNRSGFYAGSNFRYRYWTLSIHGVKCGNFKLATDDQIISFWKKHLEDENIEAGDKILSPYDDNIHTFTDERDLKVKYDKASVSCSVFLFVASKETAIKLHSKAVKEIPKEPEINQYLLERNGYNVGDYIFVDYPGVENSWIAKISQLDLDSDSDSLRCWVSARLDVRDKNIENHSSKICYYAVGQNRTVRHATPEEKGWLDYCIEHGTYKSLEEYQKVVKIEANTSQPTDDKFYVICYDVRDKGPYFIKDKCYLASNSSDKTMFILEEDGEIKDGYTKPYWKKGESKSYKSPDYSFRKAIPQEVYQSFTRFGKKITSGRIGNEVFPGTQPKLVNKITKFDKESYKRDLESLEKTTKVAVKFTKINAIPPKIKIINN